MKSNKLRVPKLRFKEFSDVWEEKKLGNYGELINGLTYSPTDIAENGLLVLRSSNIQNGLISFKDNVYVNLNVEDKYLTKENDILICVRNGSKRLIGKNIIINGQLPKSTHGAFMTLFRGKNNKFISHWFQSKIFYKQVHKNLGATINSINGSDLKKFKTIFPQKQEQEKIASFLTSIDKKIEQLSKKDELLESYKKGVMQKIFSQEIRFKKDDGSDYFDWEEKRLNKIFTVLQGYAFSSTDSVLVGIKWVKIADVGIQGMKKENLSFLPFEFKEKYKKFILKKDDFVIALTRPILSGKLKISKIDDFFDNSLLNQRVGKVVSKNNQNFIYYLLQTNYLVNKIEISILGSEPPNLSIEQIKNINIFIPSKEEQIKIANFLSSIDTKISQNKKVLEETKKFKKALLQQMFV